MKLKKVQRTLIALTLTCAMAVTPAVSYTHLLVRMHVKAKKMAFGGMLLALTIVCMLLGSIIETSTLFLLAAASFFVGIVLREFGEKTGIAFYIAGVLLGLIVAPNKFRCV